MTKVLFVQALIHPATEIPELVEFGFAVAPGTESFISVDPEVIHADEAIYKFSVNKRQCYLEGERKLKYFRQYSFLNCFLECSTNFTFQVRNAKCSSPSFVFFAFYPIDQDFQNCSN